MSSIRGSEPTLSQCGGLSNYIVRVVALLAVQDLPAGQRTDKLPAFIHIPSEFGFFHDVLRIGLESLGVKVAKEKELARELSHDESIELFENEMKV